MAFIQGVSVSSFYCNSNSNSSRPSLPSHNTWEHPINWQLAIISRRIRPRTLSRDFRGAVLIAVPSTLPVERHLRISHRSQANQSIKRWIPCSSYSNRRRRPFCPLGSHLTGHDCCRLEGVGKYTWSRKEDGGPSTRVRGARLTVLCGFARWQTTTAWISGRYWATAPSTESTGPASCAWIISNFWWGIKSMERCFIMPCVGFSINVSEFYWSIHPSIHPFIHSFTSSLMHRSIDWLVD